MRDRDWYKNGDGEIVEFTVKCKMKKCWANEFLSMLKTMEEFGNVGHSQVLAFYTDGDGDFRPKFEHDLPDFKKTNTVIAKVDKYDMFDAG